jgi:signal transduction histidine kinase/iron only hydrogenase large subunit-like protein
VMTVVRTIKENCRRCYTCIRECPAKAIRVESGQARVIPERCIGCGHCVKVCSQNAKDILSGVENVLLWLSAVREGTGKVVALIAPSFPAAFPEIPYKSFVGALKKIGFSKVVQVAYGAELVNFLYQKALKNQSGTDGTQPLLTTTCPALVEYVEKYVPELLFNLARIPSPMIAMGKVIKHVEGIECKTVFIGPCIAKKKEKQRQGNSQIIDEVLTFQELKQILDRFGIQFSEVPDRNFDPPYPGLAKIYPVPGGLVRSAGLNYDILDNSIIFTEGKRNVLKLLEYMKHGEIRAKLVDMLFCEGCIKGPAIGNELNYFSRKQKVVEFAEESKEQPFNLPEFKRFLQDIRFETDFENHDQRLPNPSQEEIKKLLRKIHKFSEQDELNCGACGYETCREYATALYKGLAEEEMCLPFLIEKLERTHQELACSLNDLKEAQEQLIQSEKLASLGQLAAGIAHEVNNPLGAIILYAHLLMKSLGEKSQAEKDLRMIIDEATRCKKIVTGLLDFARQGKLALRKIKLNNLIEQVIRRFETEWSNRKVKIQWNVEQNLEWELDPDQFLQVFLNLLRNALDALQEIDHPEIRIQISRENDELYIRVCDNGCGIPEENMPKLFTPFFTTKAPGKGTGLGLPIVYGIVKMHKGDIFIDSVEGKGTTVHIKIPGTNATGGDQNGQKDIIY